MTKPSPIPVANHSRDALIFLTQGLRSPSLINWTLFKAIFVKHNPALTESLRREIKLFMRDEILNELNQCVRTLCDPNLSTEDEQRTRAEEQRLVLYFHHLIGVIAHTSAEAGEVFIIPQKDPNDGKYKPAQYQLERIDMSPETGPLSFFLKPRDRLYALGFKPLDKAHSPIIAFQGTTFPTDQGAGLSVLCNFDVYRNHSIGESHNRRQVDQWINTLAAEGYSRVTLTGISKGGSLSQIVAGEHPEQVANAYCFSPTALHRKTLARLNATWNRADLTPENKAKIHVFMQALDFVPLFGHQFLEGSLLYHINTPGQSLPAPIAHMSLFAGRRNAVITRLQMDDVKRPYARTFFNYFLFSASAVMFPLSGLCFIINKAVEYPQYQLNEAAQRQQSSGHHNSAFVLKALATLSFLVEKLVNVILVAFKSLVVIPLALASGGLGLGAAAIVIAGHALKDKLAPSIMPADNAFPTPV
jgi:hypothetical protein